MTIIIPANSAADTAFSVDNSCRFNDDDSSYMHKTPGSGGNQKTWTFSAWVKRGTLGTRQGVINVNGASNPYFFVEFIAADNLQIQDYDGSQDTELTTTAKYRDVGAWYHICVAYDTTQATNTNRIKLYVNGTQVTAFDTSTYCAENFDSQMNSTNQLFIGQAGTQKFDGYMAEVCVVDGSQLAPTSFGEFDEDSPTIFKPIDVSGLTFGTNGFYLDFEDSSNLGNDKNGGTDLTEVNLAATDQCTDTPTNNFCTMNPLNNYYAGATFSEGNCKIVTANSSVHARVSSTIGLSAGKWYWEMKCTSGAEDGGANYDITGIEAYPAAATSHEVGNDSESYGYRSDNGQSYTNNSGSSYGDDWDDPDIIGVYLDLDNSKLYFAKNGTVQNSGTGISITATSSTSTGFYFPAICDFGGGTGTYEMNFGSPTFSLSSAVADKNGYGSFEYNPSTGTFDGASKDFLAICTKNLGSDGG